MSKCSQCSYQGLLWWLSGKESACQCRRHRFDPWVRMIPWRGKWQPTPVFLPGKCHGQRSLAGNSPWGYKESDTTEWLRKKRTQAHSCMLHMITSELELVHLSFCASVFIACVAVETSGSGLPPAWLCRVNPWLRFSSVMMSCFLCSSDSGWDFTSANYFLPSIISIHMPYCM